MKKLIGILVILTFAITACEKKWDKVEPQTAEDTIKTIEDLNVEDGFDWKTTQDIMVEVEGSADKVLQLKSLQGDTYLKAMMNADNKYSTKLTLPSYTKEVTLAFNGKIETVPIVNNKISFTFN